MFDENKWRKEIIAIIERKLFDFLDLARFNFAADRYEQSIEWVCNEKSHNFSLIVYPANNTYLPPLVLARATVRKGDFPSTKEALAKLMQTYVPEYFDKNKFIIRDMEVVCIAHANKEAHPFMCHFHFV